MAYEIRTASYYYFTVADEPSAGYQILSLLAEQGVDLLAFAALPLGPMHTQLTLFPSEDALLEQVAKRAEIQLDGPHPALLVTGDNELGALAEVHAELAEAGVDVYASSGVAGGQGRYGCVIYVRPDAYRTAVKALGL